MIEIKGGPYLHYSVTCGEGEELKTLSELDPEYKIKSINLRLSEKQAQRIANELLDRVKNPRHESIELKDGDKRSFHLIVM